MYKTNTVFYYGIKIEYKGELANMDIITSAAKVEKDIEIYTIIRDTMHKIFTEIKESDDIEEIDLKELKLKLDIADKSIQNRLKLLIHIGKLDIDADNEEELNDFLEDFSN